MPLLQLSESQEESPHLLWDKELTPVRELDSSSDLLATSLDPGKSRLLAKGLLALLALASVR
jgi:hypothetical protein